jgi:hypothetical protein
MEIGFLLVYLKNQFFVLMVKKGLLVFLDCTPSSLANIYCSNLLNNIFLEKEIYWIIDVSGL